MAKKLPKQVQTLVDEITENDYEIVKAGKPLRLGNLYLYYYPDPKTKDKLDVFDTLPLVVLLDVPDGKYILGINLHYIPYLKRLQFMKGLMSKGTKIKYSDIKKAWKNAKIPNAYAHLAIRKYLVNRIASNIRVFEEPEDQYRIVKEVLPDFKKKSMSQVYRDIEKQLTRQRKNK